MNLRPNNCKSDRLFLNYQNKKCTNQPIGENKFSSFPKMIAMFLRLPNPELYTGHAYRRSAASIIADGGRTIEDVQNAGGWDSPTTANGYVDRSFRSKQIAGGIRSNNSYRDFRRKDVQNGNGCVRSNNLYRDFRREDVQNGSGGNNSVTANSSSSEEGYVRQCFNMKKNTDNATVIGVKRNSVDGNLTAANISDVKMQKIGLTPTSSPTISTDVVVSQIVTQHVLNDNFKERSGNELNTYPYK